MVLDAQLNVTTTVMDDLGALRAKLRPESSGQRIITYLISALTLITVWSNDAQICTHSISQLPLILNHVCQ